MAWLRGFVVVEVLVFLFACNISSSNAVKPIPTDGLRSHVAVEGIIYCPSCNKTLVGAPPLPGAIARVQCNDTKVPISVEGKSNSHGYFYIEIPKLKLGTMKDHKCKTFLVSSPSPACNKTSSLHGGITGGSLTFKAFYVKRYAGGITTGSIAVFTTGPFAFAPKHCPKPKP